MQGVDQHVNWPFPPPLEQASMPGRDHRQLPASCMPTWTLIVPRGLNTWEGPRLGHPGCCWAQLNQSVAWNFSGTLLGLP